MDKQSEWFDKVHNELPKRKAIASTDYIEAAIGEEVVPYKPVKAEEYADFAESPFAEESPKKKAQRERLQETGAIGVKVQGLKVTEDSRIRGQNIGELLPEDEFPRNTQDW